MRFWLLVGVTGAALFSVWVAFRLWPRELVIALPGPPNPVIELETGGTTVKSPGRTLVGDAAWFDDELLAYLIFARLRGIVTPDDCRVWLTYQRQGKSIAYVIRLHAGDNLLTALPYFAGLHAAGVAGPLTYRWVTKKMAAAYAAETQTFERAYNLPAFNRLEHLPRSDLVSYLRRFIRFKAVTDPRIRRGDLPKPRLPGADEAHRLADDIVTVADFYGLPLDFFLGIGAMENNYMNVKGDLGNAVWKRRPDRGDVILRRGRKGVMVLNESSGIWQITRETLRFAHRLYLSGTRDYSLLPERLRPPKELDVNDIPPDVLTTYAGLLFRNLLDRFNGDVASAVGAYNGGPGNPNQRYEAGVRTVAAQARRVIEHAAVLQGRPAYNMQFLMSNQ